jgi:glyoxylase-like metal-dependent hydrolase (beta-lactamase superfamily II)
LLNPLRPHRYKDSHAVKREGEDCDLFSGDFFANTDKPAMNSLFEDSAEMDATAKRLRTLQIRTVYPGHGKPFQMQQFIENRQ